MSLHKALHRWRALAPPVNCCRQRKSHLVNLQFKAMAVKRLDSHLHVWASKEDAESGKYPFAVRSYVGSLHIS
jgi:hypothetical protein